MRTNPQLVVSALIALLLVWSLASLLRTQASPVRTGAAGRAPTVDLRSIGAAHLFGIAPGSESVGDTTSQPVKLLLLGTLVNNDRDSARAIVSVGDPSITRIFRVGDRLPGGAVLLEVRPHSILISHGGGTEPLAFPQRFAASLAALMPDTVDEVAETDATDATDATRIYVTPPGSAKVEDYYAEQQAALASEVSGS